MEVTPKSAEPLTATPTPVRRRLLVSAATNWLAFAAAMLTTFFLSPYLIAKLGSDLWGVWGFVESLLHYFTLFDLGVASCMVRYVARHHAQNDQHELNKTVSAGLAIFVVAGLAVLVLGLALVPILRPTLEAKVAGAHDAVAFMAVMVFALAATLPLSAFPSVLDGMERYAVKSLVRVVFLALRVGGYIWVCETAPGLLNLGLVYAVTHLAEHAVYAVLCFRFMPGLRFSYGLIDRATFRKVRVYSVDAFLAMVAGRMSVQSMPVVIGLYLAFSQVTYFLLAFRLVDMAKTMLRQVTTTLTPAISSLDAAGDHEAIRRVLLGATRWVLYLILPVQVGLWVFGRAFLTRWLGDPVYGEVCGPVLWILAGGMAVGLAQSACARVLYGTGRLRLFSRLVLAEAVVTLGTSLAVVSWAGIVGVAWAVTIPNVIGCAICVAYTCRCVGLSAGEYLRSWVGPLTLASLPTLIWLTAVDTSRLDGWLGLFAAGMSGLIPYAVAVALVEGRPVGRHLRRSARRFGRGCVTLETPQARA